MDLRRWRTRNVLLLILAVAPPAVVTAENVASIDSAVLDGGTALALIAPEDDLAPIKLELGNGVHSITVKGRAAAGETTVRLNLAEDGDGVLADAVVNTPPGGAFTVVLSFECRGDPNREFGQVVGANGLETGEGTPSNPAEVFVRDGTRRVPDPGEGTSFWDIVCLAGGSGAAVVRTVEQWTMVPARADIHQRLDRPARDLEDADIRTIFGRANRILSQARVHLDLRQIQAPVAFPPTGPGGVLVFPADPHAAAGLMAGYSNTMLATLDPLRFGAGGYIALFANVITSGSDVPTGLSQHTIPVGYLSALPDRSNAKRGETLSHEFCHAFTLGKTHAIRSLVTQVADNGGHACETNLINCVNPANPGEVLILHDNDGTVASVVRGFTAAQTRALAEGRCVRFITCDRTNLMYPTAERDDTLLSEMQRKGCNGGLAQSRGILKERIGDPVMRLLATKRASWVDAVGDVADSTAVDLVHGSLFALGDDGELEVRVAVADALPADEQVDVVYQLALDTDADATTGVTVGSFAGIDRIVEMTLVGSSPFTPPSGAFGVELVDPVTGVRVPIGERRGVRQDSVLFEAAPGTFPDPYPPSSSTIRATVPLSMLEPLADAVPAAVLATDRLTGNVDEAPFLFVVTPPIAPFVEMEPLEGGVRDAVVLAGRNYPPGGPVRVIIDGEDVASAPTAPDGTVQLSFAVPASLPPGSHFVVLKAADETSDFSVLRVDSCRIDTNGDGIPDITLPDADKNARCEFPTGKTVLRGTFRVTEATPIEFRGTTIVEADRIVVDPGATVYGTRDTLRSLTMVALDGDVDFGGTARLGVSDDLMITSRRGGIRLAGSLRLEAADRLVLDARGGDVSIVPTASDDKDWFDIFATNRLNVYARSAAGSIVVEQARLGSRTVTLTNRANVSVLGTKAILLGTGTLVATAPGLTGVTNSSPSDVVISSTGRVTLSGATLESGRNVRIDTSRSGDDLCMGQETALRALQPSGRTGYIDLSAVRGRRRDDGTTTFVGQIRGTIENAPCS